MHRLQDKVALVTGASRGIGHGIALAFAAEGADVAVNYRVGEEQANAVVAEIQKAGRRALAVRADVSSVADVQRMMETVLATFGRLDILVNNAGILNKEAPVVDLPVEVWDDMIAVDLRSVFLVTKFALPAMLERRYGKIISISSLVAEAGRPHFTHYAAAKAGITGFSKSLAHEVGPHNINVNVIACGAVDTEILVGHQSEEWRAEVIKKAAMRRFGEIADVASTAIFLASDEARHYTGQTFQLSGGSYMP